MRIQGVPERPDGREGGRSGAAHGGVERVVPVGQPAQAWVAGEIVLEPLHLRRGGRLRDVAVERDDVPLAQIEAVVPLPRRAGGGGPEVIVVGLRVGLRVVVVAGRRMGPGLVPAPGRRVAIGELAGRPVGVGVVPHGEDRRLRHRVEQLRGLFVARLAGVARGDVARAHQDRRDAGRLDRDPQRRLPRPGTGVVRAGGHGENEQDSGTCTDQDTCTAVGRDCHGTQGLVAVGAR